MKLKRLNKRGFSLVEVIIAMAVVSIVTFAALSIIYPATDKTVEANAQSNAIYFAADAIECFKATDNVGELISTMSFRDGMNLVNDPTLLPGNIAVLCSGYYVFQTESGSCYVGVQIDASDSNKLYIRAVSNNGNILIDETFTKSPR